MNVIENPDLFSGPNIGLKIPSKAVRRARNFAGSALALTMGFLAGHWICIATALGGTMSGGLMGGIFGHAGLRFVVGGIAALASLWGYKQLQYRFFRYDCCDVKPGAVPVRNKRRIFAQYALTTTLSATSAAFVPQWIGGHAHHGHKLYAIDFSRCVLLSAKGNGDSLLVAVGENGAPVFVRGNDSGVRMELMCNAEPELNLPRSQPSAGVTPLSLAEAGEIMRAWPKAELAGLLREIEQKQLAPAVAQSLAEAIEKAWKSPPRAALAEMQHQHHGR